MMDRGLGALVARLEPLEDGEVITDELLDAALVEALEKIWQGGSRPEYAYVNGEMIQMYGDLQRAESICSPAGLRSIFPALKAR